MYFRKSYNNLSKGKIVRNQRPVISHVADDVWASACAAHRINGSYVKLVTSYATNEEILDNSLQQADKKTNRQLMYGLLDDTSQITEQDREQGLAVRQYYKAFTFKILQGKKLSEFDSTAMSIANRDEITSDYDIAVIASLPSCYLRNVERDNLDRKMSSANGGLIGKVGDKVKATLEIVKVTFSQQYNCYFISGLTDKNQAVFFAYNREGVKVGDTINVQGTVKAHRDGTTTQLNRVKVI